MLHSTHVAFAADHLLAEGTLTEVLATVKIALDAGEDRPVLLFETQTGRQVDFNFRGTLEDVLRHAQPKEAPKGPGRPSLGVESREVTLLPRHWAWLQTQPNGASAALRRLVEAASQRFSPEDELRRKREAVYGIMSAMAGNRTGFEEAARALFAGNQVRFAALIAPWPADIRKHLLGLLAAMSKPSSPAPKAGLSPKA